MSRAAAGEGGAGGGDGDALGRKSAEGGARQVARGAERRADPRRADARRGRGRQERAARLDRQARGGGVRRAAHLERAAGAARAVVADPRAARGAARGRAAARGGDAGRGAATDVGAGGAAYFLTAYIAAECPGSSTRSSPVTLDVRCAHRSRASCVPAESPSSFIVTAWWNSVVPRLRSTTARSPFLIGFIQTSSSPSSRILCPCLPPQSWFTAMTSLFIRISFVESLIARRSLPAMSGALSSAQRLKCAMYSGFVIRPLPTSSMSGSFHAFGPEYCSSPTCRSRRRITDGQRSLMSPVVRQSCPPT